MLGPLHLTVWDEESQDRRIVKEFHPQQISLLELPEEAARRGFRAVEICHVHFHATDYVYLLELKRAFAEAGVSFDTLLLDYGDLTSSNERRAESDFRYMCEWVEYASIAGAKRIRVMAGEAEPASGAAMERAANYLLMLSEFAGALDVEVVTVNGKALTSTGDSCLRLMEKTELQVGMITDFGNFSGHSKYEDLSLTIPYSSIIHAKADCDEFGNPDVPEFQRCLEVARRSRFDGSVVIIYDGPGDMWEGIERVRQLVTPILV
ncbi:sugar phosphate isomerase/epimerase family protein [Paenibacillus sp. GCM10027627]|uniref:sugar phosphate isomerase/epimerase family protein n=1 Tax=unclassified Paenibacillus TaxID=185978 RepID=UPI0036397158